MKELSLLDRLQNLSDSGQIPMHMPGHKRNEALADYLHTLGAKLDITEITGFDDLHDAQGILQEAQARAAALWKTRKSWFLINGSTGGILAGVRALAPAGSRVLVARACHKSVFNALELCRLRPAFLQPQPVPGWSFAGPVSPAALAEGLARFPDAKLVILTSPTYEGLISDLPTMVKLAHDVGVPVLVDEAHGAHLGLFGAFPAGAVAAGADLVIQSLHKTLPSLTQTAMLHCAGPLADPAAVERQLAVFETSSPSYLLMASLDGCVSWLTEQGGKALPAWRARLERFRSLTGTLHSLCLLGDESDLPFARDPGKIVIGSGPLTGRELKDRLREEYSIELEMAGADWALAMTGPGDTDETLDTLAKALRGIDEQLLSAPPAPPLPVLPLPEATLAPWEAMERPSEQVPLEQAAGRISAGYLWAYPPGIPLILPGERVDETFLQGCRALTDRGVVLHSGEPDGNLRVLTD